MSTLTSNLKLACRLRTSRGLFALLRGSFTVSKGRSVLVLTLLPLTLVLNESASAETPSDITSVTGPETKEVSEPFIPPQEEEEWLQDKVENLRQEQLARFKEITEDFFKEMVTGKYVIEKKHFMRPGERTLMETLERASQVDLSVQIAEEKKKLAKMKTLSAFRELLAGVLFDFEFRQGSLSRDAFRGEDFTIRFTQPVYRGGSLWNKFREEKALLKSAQADYKKALQELTLQVTKAYAELLRDSSKMESRKALLSKIDEFRTLSTKKHEQGLISEMEYLNVESIAAQAGHDYEAANEEYEISNLELKKLLGLEPDEPIDFEPLYEYDTLLEHARKEAKAKGKEAPLAKSDEAAFKQKLDEYIDLAYQNKPDLKVEANRLRSKIMGERAARGKLRPQVDVLLEYGELQDVFADQVRGRFHNPEFQFKTEVTWNLGGNTAKYGFDHEKNAPSVAQFLAGTGTDTTKNTFSAALLDNLKDLYGRQEARVELKEQLAKLEEKERDMIRDVKTVYFKFHRAQIQVFASLRKILYRERAVELSKVKLDKNEIQISEYLQSELDLEKEKSELHNAMAEYYKAKAALNRAVGVPDLFKIERWEIEALST